MLRDHWVVIKTIGDDAWEYIGPFFSMRTLKVWLRAQGTGAYKIKWQNMKAYRKYSEES